MTNHELIQFIDLTSLSDDDNENTIKALCDKAVTPFGHVAAVCIYGKFIRFAKTLLTPQTIPIATVANFPHGTNTQKTTCHEIENLLLEGADEIDVVINYKDFINGNKQCIYQLVSACKTITDTTCLKVILETGELKTPALIDYASKAALDAGADFIKTSTGKVLVNATTEAADVMLNAIATINPDAGFKAAGGIQTPGIAHEYVTLALKHLGQSWLKPSHFRIGASRLLSAIIYP